MSPAKMPPATTKKIVHKDRNIVPKLSFRLVGGPRRAARVAIEFHWKENKISRIMKLKRECRSKDRTLAAHFAEIEEVKSNLRSIKDQNAESLRAKDEALTAKNAEIEKLQLALRSVKDQNADSPRQLRSREQTEESQVFYRRVIHKLEEENRALALDLEVAQEEHENEMERYAEEIDRQDIEIYALQQLAMNLV